MFFLLAILCGWQMGYLEKIADSDAYLSIIERINQTGWQEDIDFAFNFEVLIFEDLNLFGESALVAARFLNMAFVFFAFAILFPINSSRLAAFSIIFAFFGPLLSLVLLRGAPAYALVMLAIHFYQSRRLFVGLGALMLSSIFHVTAVAAIVPYVLSAFLERVKVNIAESKAALFIVALFSSAIIFANMTGFNFINIVFQSVDVGKYAVYSSDGTGDFSSLHSIYYALVIFLYAVFLKNKSLYTPFELNYISISMIVFLVISGSPVFAFRQSIFWLPVMLYRIDSWNYINFKITKFLAVLFSVPLFIYSLGAVSG